jgi:adenine deaminase
LHPLIDRCPDQVMLCSDDKHPDDLLVGHINTLAARAVVLGHEVFNVLQCACVNPVRHYRLPLGQLHTGEPMDAILVNNLHDFIALKTWIEGQLTAERGESLLPSVTPL